MLKKSSLFAIALFHSLLLVVAALVLCHPIAAYAGMDTPAPEAPPPPQMEMFGTPVAIVPDGYFAISLFQYPAYSEDEFTLRLSQYGTVAGCTHLQRGGGYISATGQSMDNTTIKYISDRMEAMLDVPVIALNDGKPRYTNYDCKASNLESYVNIDLNRDRLINKNIKKFAFKTPSIDLGTYDVDIRKDRLIFKSKFANEVPEAWLTLWFFPKDTIKLYVPGAKSDHNIINEIRDFGIAHGLIPMDEVLKGYTLPHQANNYAYFTDPKRVFVRDLSLQNDTKQIGKVGITKTYQGPQGAHDRIVPMPIFANLVDIQKIYK